MTIKPTSQRHVTTLLYLLRGYADQQRRMHGAMVERPGGIELTPSEMDAWADELEAEALPDQCPEFEERSVPSNSEDSWLTT